MNTDAIAAALTDAMPVLWATAFPALICIGAAAALEWHRLSGDDDPYTVDDYKPATTARAAVYRYQAPVDGPTQVIRRVLPDAGTPVYDQLAARATAHQWLRDIAATHTFMHNTNEGSLR